MLPPRNMVTEPIVPREIGGGHPRPPCRGGHSSSTEKSGGSGDGQRRPGGGRRPRPGTLARRPTLPSWWALLHNMLSRLDGAPRAPVNRSGIAPPRPAFFLSFPGYCRASGLGVSLAPSPHRCDGLGLHGGAAPCAALSRVGSLRWPWCCWHGDVLPPLGCHHHPLIPRGLGQGPGSPTGPNLPSCRRHSSPAGAGTAWGALAVYGWSRSCYPAYIRWGRGAFSGQALALPTCGFPLQPLALDPDRSQPAMAPTRHLRHVAALSQP